MFRSHVFSHEIDANVRFPVDTKSYWQKMTPLLRLVHTIKRKVMRLETTCFHFPRSGSSSGKRVIQARKSYLAGVIRYQMVFIREAEPIEANSKKIYGATKAHRISTNNILAS